jgi:hypothetical protein
MSTRYLPPKPMLIAELFDGRLEEFGVHEFIDPEATDGMRFLTDGQVYMWVFGDDHGFVADIVGCSCCGTGEILEAVAAAFDTHLVPEDDPRYRDAQLAAWDEGEKIFVRKILKYLRGEPHDIRPGTDDMLYAEIAKRLVEDDPSLLLPGRHAWLFAEMEATFQHLTMHQLLELSDPSGAQVKH